jgi:hypothetical protein
MFAYFSSGAAGLPMQYPLDHSANTRFSRRGVNLVATDPLVEADMNVPSAVAAVGLALLAVFSPTTRAEDSGLVQGIYFEAAPGVLSTTAVLNARADARRWADVELAPDASGAERRVLVEIPPGLEARVGDRVGVELNVRPRSALLRRDAPVQRVGRVTNVQPSILAGIRG